jgi:alpha-tubulin suppressor-like RCC1 family protein
MSVKIVRRSAVATRFVSRLATTMALIATILVITTASTTAPTVNAEPSESIGTSPQGTVPMIAAGDTHTCALLNTGDISCWGNDDYGQLGNGPDGSLTVPSEAITLPGVGTTATAITSGD